MDISKVGENIDTIRKSRGWSKAELARRTGFSQMLVGKHINQDWSRYGMNVTTLITYAEVLGCTLDDLTGDAIDPLKFDREADVTNIYPYNLAVSAVWFDFDGDLSDESRQKTAYETYVLGLFQAIAELSEREQQVIILRYKHDFTLDDVASPFHVTRERIRQIEHKALRKLRARRNYWVIECIKKEVAAQARRQIGNHNDFDNLPISNLGLSVRAYNCLRRSGIDTLGKLSEMTYDDLMKVRNIGRKSVEEIITTACKYGITFKWKGEANDQN